MTTPQEAAAQAAQIAEFTVARLGVKPGDVVVVKVKDDGRVPKVDADEMAWLQKVLSDWAEARRLAIHFLVVPDSFDFSIVHTLTTEEVEKAGAGGWPHEKETT